MAILLSQPQTAGISERHVSIFLALLKTLLFPFQRNTHLNSLPVVCFHLSSVAVSMQTPAGHMGIESSSGSSVAVEPLAMREGDGVGVGS
jgi:hypothetical protein